MSKWGLAPLSQKDDCLCHELCVILLFIYIFATVRLGIKRKEKIMEIYMHQYYLLDIYNICIICGRSVLLWLQLSVYSKTISVFVFVWSNGGGRYMVRIYNIILDTRTTAHPHYAKVHEISCAKYWFNINITSLCVSLPPHNEYFMSSL